VVAVVDNGPYADSQWVPIPMFKAIAVLTVLNAPKKNGVD